MGPENPELGASQWGRRQGVRFAWGAMCPWDWRTVDMWFEPVGEPVAKV
jgi:hypothetical protein